MNTLRQIFREHFPKMLVHGVITCILVRDIVIETIEKFINCGQNGYATFGCERCDEFYHINFRCKSRFCNTCGYRYNLDRAAVMAHKVFDCPHRHCIFTIPDTLRNYFRRDRELLNCLFEAVSLTIERQSRGQTLAYICVLHTFGRDLKWNPHIHVLLAEGGADKYGNWINRSYFSYESFRKSFQTILLNMLHDKLGEDFKKIKDECYKNAPNGFFVHAPKSKGKIRKLINYIGRYLGRPVIANSRIDSYDGTYVEFHYQRHEDSKTVTEKIPATEFIKRLIIHIPERYFNMVRYYGLYWRDTPKSARIAKVLKERHKRLSFRELLLKTLGVDPHSCRKCGNTLVFIRIVYKPNNEILLYRPNAPPTHIA